MNPVHTVNTVQTEDRGTHAKKVIHLIDITKKNGKVTMLTVP